MKRTILALATAGLTVGFASLSHAYLYTTDAQEVFGQGRFSVVTGATTHAFNDAALPAGYSGGSIVQGTVPAVNIAPAGDETTYWSLGNSHGETGVAQFSAPLDYFGFDWGTRDSYNVVSLYRGDQLLSTVTGADFSGPSGFINIFAQNANEYFDRVVFWSATNAFETDNHAWRAAAPVPEPGTYAIMVAGLLAFGAVARRRLR